MGRVVPAIVAGGVAGAVVRWGIGEVGWTVAVELLVVNTLGCLLLGALVARLPQHDHPIRLAAGVGFCGGLTTFSGLAVKLADQLDGGSMADAGALMAGSLGFGIVGFLLGRRLA